MICSDETCQVHYFSLVSFVGFTLRFFEAYFILRERERGRERQREREREKERQRQRERDRDRERERKYKCIYRSIICLHLSVCLLVPPSVSLSLAKL